MSRTLTIGTRVSPTTLANLAKFLAQKVKHPKNRAQIVRLSLEMLEQIAITKGWVVPVGSTQEATIVLREHGINILASQKNAAEVGEMMRQEIDIPAQMAEPSYGSDEDLLEVARRVVEKLEQEVTE